MDREYLVMIYFTSNNEDIVLKSKTRRKAREISKRIITEGCWIYNDALDEEEFYPVNQIYKVKVKGV